MDVKGTRAAGPCMNYVVISGGLEVWMSRGRGPRALV